MDCGLIGRKLGHSFSPKIHSLLGNYPYRLIPLEPEEVGEFPVSYTHLRAHET